MGWVAECRIPFSALGVEAPADGAVWSANFVHRLSVPVFPFRMAPVHDSWAPSGADPLAAESAGFLIFR
jgi:hypothetical protein